MSDYFSAPPSAPTLASYQQPSFSSALNQYLGQSSQLPQLQTMANTINQGSNTAYQNMVFGTAPGLQQNLNQFGQNTSALLQGQIPQDVQTQIQNSSAYNALVGGFGGSNMAHAATARDLGTTSLALQQQGASQLSQQQQLAQALNPTNVNTSNMIYSPSTILSSDQQAALINNQIGNQNLEIGYQNQLTADKGSPFQQTLTNNLASLLGSVTNPLTAVSSIMGAEGGTYNAANANAGANYMGIPSGGMASMGTYAVDPTTGQNVGTSTPGSTSGSSGAGGVMGSASGIGSLLSGLACCFIFVFGEVLRTEMPTWIRLCRDEFAPDGSAARMGYIAMAGWFVPIMRQSLIARLFVTYCMVKPLELWGGWYKRVPRHGLGWAFGPVVWFWFKVWEFLGRKANSHGL